MLHFSISMLLSILTILVIIPLSVYSFGHDGHEIVANIANKRLKRETSQVLNEILDGASLSNISNWADSVTNSMAWSSSLHFINIEQSPCSIDNPCYFEYNRDCKDDQCVAGAVVNYTSIMYDLNETYYNTELANNATKFLIHFMGDIHQPLHCGRDIDRGGVLINVHFYVPEQGSDWSLHNVWDFGLIVRSINETYHGSQDAFTRSLLLTIDTKWKDEISEWTSCVKDLDNGNTSSVELKHAIHECVVEWGQESLEYALSKSYLNEHGNEIQDNETLTDEYFYMKLPDVEKRLAMGGVRLQAILELLF